MKQNLENSIKNSLENFELPYDASAWTALSKKLDVVQPVTTPKSNLGTWGIAAGTVIAISVGAYFFFTKDSTTNSKEAISQTTTEETIAPENTTNTSLDESSNVQSDVKITDVNSSTDAAPVKPSTLKTTPSNDPVKLNPFGPSTAGGNGVGAGNDNGNINKLGNNNSTSNTGNSATTAYSIPKIQDVCQGESITIKNDNDFDISVQTPTNSNLVIAKNKSLKLSANDAGVYTVNVKDKNSTFTVVSKPKLDFTIDEQTQYENGVPSTPLQTFSEGSNFVWTFDDSSVKLKGSSVDAHFFTKGTKTITLSTEGEKGCSSKITKSIDISSDYKLFAPTGFEPNHIDIRRARFIPNALIARDVQFTMIIVDPKTGATVFTTDNAANGWDGIDKNTGELVPEGSTYVWKVFLKNPLPGEKSEYSSTVVRR